MISWFSKLFFFLKVSNNRQRIGILFVVIKCVYSLPGIIFHEACHLIMAFITQTKIKHRYTFFLRIKNDTKHKKISMRYYGCSFTIKADSTPIQILLVGAAPAIGTVVLFSSFLFFHFYYPFIYYFTAFDAFALSKADNNCIASSLIKLKRQVIESIESVITYNSIQKNNGRD